MSIIVIVIIYYNCPKFNYCYFKIISNVSQLLTNPMRGISTPLRRVIVFFSTTLLWLGGS